MLQKKTQALTLDQKIDNTSFLEEIKNNDLMSKRHKKVCRV